MENGLYISTVTCPVCSKKFEVTKVKSSACRVASRDTDMCVYYETVNPLIYDIWVCENCGYAAQNSKFETISSKDVKVIQENISSRWHKRSFAGERDLDHAIEAFKLALVNLHIRNAKSSEIAKICIRLAWMYRMKKEADKEREFLEFALKSYAHTYENEKFPADKMDENTCMYIIAELNRRIENYDEAVKWFSRLISSPDARRNSKLIENAREQFQLTKEQMGKAQETASGVE